MDYKAQVRDMLTHLATNPDSMTSNLVKLLSALGDGIAKTMALIDGHEEMHRVLEAYLAAVSAACCFNHADFAKARGIEMKDECEGEPQEQTIDYESFLRDVFQPTKMND